MVLVDSFMTILKVSYKGYSISKHNILKHNLSKIKHVSISPNDMRCTINENKCQQN